ncbi:BsuBI/PstI family type II restriction endonuclease [Nostoc sp. CALU 1950]|uniref:BsuBI/PstI family type II restriction endonuclease n=1 Tax=Nostoc sp. CALU 1950 TaxID=3104321 RepID=UPI003EB79997
MIVPSSSRAFVASHNSNLEFTSLAKLSSGNLLAEVDLHRAVASLKLRQDKKASMGQFLTPASVAQLMVGMFNKLDLPEISLLDAGAGIGSLLAAFVEKVCQHRQQTSSLRVVAYEIDPFLIRYLHQTLELCERECQRVGISFNYEIRETDFIEDAVRLLQMGLLNSANATEFTHAILNPPYLKINAHSKVRELLRSIGLEITSNGKLIYVGDTDEKFAHFDEAALADLGVNIDSHGKMPDVIIHFTTNNWLVLIEAVTSHGPINPKRKKELEVLFRAC